MTLVNELMDVDNGGEMNSHRTPNTTNLHTHGLHVSSASPGVSIYNEVRSVQCSPYYCLSMSRHLKCSYFPLTTWSSAGVLWPLSRRRHLC